MEKLFAKFENFEPYFSVSPECIDTKERILGRMAEKETRTLPLVWVERGEPHEEEGEDEEDKDEPPEGVNHTHRHRDGQGAHEQTNIKVP